MGLLTSAELKRLGLTTRPWLQRNWKWIGGLILAALLLSRVSFHFGYVDEDKKEAGELIEQFHRRMNTDQFQEIYDGTHPAFRRALSKQEWLQHMKDTQEQYGHFSQVKSSDFNVIMGAPIQICAAYVSTFEKGEATELFTFAREGHNVQLLAYGIFRRSTQLNPSPSRPKAE